MNSEDTKPGLPETLPPTSRSLPIALMRAREKVMTPIREMLAKSGITEQQWRVLRVLAEFGPQDASNLAERSCLMMPSLTRIVQTLLNNGYVTRETDPDDRRRHVVAITDNGRKIIEDNLQAALEISRKFIDALGQERFDDLLDSLEKLNDI